MKRFIRAVAQKPAEGEVGNAVGEASEELPVHKTQQYIAEGYCWVLDLDWEKFFDRVNHDRLLAAVAERVAHKRTRITARVTEPLWVGRKEVYNRCHSRSPGRLGGRTA